MLGYILYNKEDYKKNSSYVNWIKEIGKKRGLDIELRFSEEFYSDGMNTKNIDFVINRSRDYNISLVFELNNVRVFNNSQITLLGNNKLAAYKYVNQLGIKHPRVYSYWGDSTDVISKPIDGHGGAGIDFIQNINLNQGSFRVQQEFMKHLLGDLRFYIINNEIIHGVIRSSNNGITSNYSQGGNIKLFDIKDYHIKTVNKILKEIKADYIGLDFLVTQDGELFFNEIEDVVGSRMLSELGINNTTELYIEHIHKQMR